MRKIFVVLILIILVAPAFSAASIETFFIKDLAKESKLQNIKNENIRPACFGRTYMVEMRDGIKLATDVYRPILRFFPHGTILIRTPYNKDDLKNLGFFLALIGWPMVIQDMRGRHASEGNNTVYRICTWD